MKHGHASRRHGKWSASPTYTSWKTMRARCYQQSNPRFEKYGQRGIRVIDRWGDFSNFLADMGERPSLEHSIERIDNDGNYEPENCRWATEAEQQRNRSNNRFVTYNGEKLCVTDWATKLGIDPRRIFQRLAKGWSEEDAVSVVRGARWQKLHHNGMELTIREWAAHIGIARNTLARKLKAESLSTILGRVR